MHNVAFMYALGLTNKTGRKKLNLLKAQDVEFYYYTIVIKVEGACWYL